MEAYHYTECGLDNVFIKGMIPCQDNEGDDVFTIPNVSGLHKVITETIVDRDVGMTGQELRFIRTEIGMTQAELAKVVHHDAQSVGRWERNEFPVDQNAEALIRLLAIERLSLKVDSKTVAELSSRCVPSAAPKQIIIDGHDPSHYKEAA
jgi:DNA-binding transcriptional regulator YiaG